MAAFADPFSFATVELSQEFVNIFSDPDIVLKYLDTVVSKTTGVKRSYDCDSSGITVSGSWISLTQVHSFLEIFLWSYQTKSRHKLPSKKDPDTSNKNDLKSYGDNGSDDVGELADTADRDSQFYDDSNWVKHTAEVLPQTQRTRPRHVATLGRKKQTPPSSRPEPQVLYANFEPILDPSVKKPTLNAIGEELKAVYSSRRDTEQSANDNMCAEEAKNTPSTLLIGHGFIPNVNTNNNSEQIAQTYASTPIGAVTSNVSHANFGDHCLLSSSLGESKAVHTVGIGDQTKLSSVVETERLLLESSGQSFSADDHSNQPFDLNSKVICGVSTLLQNNQPCIDETGRGTQKITRIKRVHQENTQKRSRHKQTLTVREESKNMQRAVPSTRTSSRLLKRKFTESAEETGSVPALHGSHAKKPRQINRKMSHTSDDCDSDNVTLTESVQTKCSKENLHCDLCPYVAKKKSNLGEHKRRKHLTKNFKCEECGVWFGLAKDLNRHLETHRKAEKCCDICGKRYKGSRSLAEHSKTHDKDYAKPEWPCKFCNKIFSTKYVLAYHIKSEHLGMKKTYLCHTCGKSFSQKNSYLQHANVHMGIRPFECDICGKTFSYEKSLKEHRYMHSDDRHFECEVCHKKFRQSAGLVIHMKIHKKHKDYVCSACGKGFSQKQALVRHERIHVGDKPFSCGLCERTFTDSSILRRHMILLHKKDPKNWKEDTCNNLQRRTDFFISVFGEAGKSNSDREIELTDQSAIVKSQSGQEQVHNQLSLPLPEENTARSNNSMIDGLSKRSPQLDVDGEDSFTFISVGHSVSCTRAQEQACDTVDIHLSDTMVMMSQADLGHHPVSHSTVLTSGKVQSSIMMPKAEQPASSLSANSSTFAESTESAASSQMENLQASASGLLQSFPLYAVANPNLHPSHDLFPGEMAEQQSAGVDVSPGLQQLHQYTTLLAPAGNGGYHQQGIVMLPDTLSSLSFHSNQLVSPSDLQTVHFQALAPDPQQHPFADHT